MLAHLENIEAFLKYTSIVLKTKLNLNNLQKNKHVIFKFSEMSDQ